MLLLMLLLLMTPEGGGMNTVLVLYGCTPAPISLGCTLQLLPSMFLVVTLSGQQPYMLDSHDMGSGGGYCEQLLPIESALQVIPSVHLP